MLYYGLIQAISIMKITFENAGEWHSWLNISLISCSHMHSRSRHFLEISTNVCRVELCFCPFLLQKKDYDQFTGIQMTLRAGALVQLTCMRNSSTRARKQQLCDQVCLTKPRPGSSDLLCRLEGAFDVSHVKLAWWSKQPCQDDTAPAYGQTPMWRSFL